MAFQSGKLPVCNAETLANIADPDQVAMRFSADSWLTPQCKWQNVEWQKQPICSYDQKAWLHTNSFTDKPLK